MTLIPSPKTLAGILAVFVAAVALFLSPGGVAETASTHIARVARKTSAPPPPVAPRPVPQTDAPRAWFAPDEGVAPLAPAVQAAPVAVPPGDPQPIYFDPPPQGPDFPPAPR